MKFTNWLNFISILWTLFCQFTFDIKIQAQTAYVYGKGENITFAQKAARKIFLFIVYDYRGFLAQIYWSTTTSVFATIVAT